MLGYILWDYSSVLFSFGKFTLRWDGFLLILAFIVGRQILIHIYEKEGQPKKEVDILARYLVIGSFVGARLGHVIFFQPEQWAMPLTIFLPFEFNPFLFIGFSGFSIHGAVLGILLAIWIYTRKMKQAHPFMYVLDRTSIFGMWILVFMLVGSFLNSEVEGKPTNSFAGTVFINPIVKGLQRLPCCMMRNPGGKSPLTKVIAKKENTQVKNEHGHQSVVLYFFFNSGTAKSIVNDYLIGDVKTYLYDMAQYVYEPGTEPLHYSIFEEANGDFEARVSTLGIARHPVQLYMAFSALLLLSHFAWYWNKFKLSIKPGRIFGFGMAILWSLQFLFEFLKENQASFITGIGLNKAQVLCVPFILVGIYCLILSYRKVEIKN
ncbi:MAG: prolipoprotein diacylglyceryl transferase [Bacteroidia bacterium]|nr:prolipoprotein diacylglyceryl transferase [Bacteroidia bacterium]